MAEAVPAAWNWVAAPGPWNWVATDIPSANGGFHAYVVDANGRKIAAVWGKAGEKEMTAHKMAAAPAIFAAAEALLEKIGNVTGIEPERKAMIAALNDALGITESMAALAAELPDEAASRVGGGYQVRVG